jgi:hypothetical protein
MLASLCLLGATAPAASADASAKIIERCAQGQPVAGFTVEQYQHALKSMTTEEIEYHGECVEVIESRRTRRQRRLRGRRPARRRIAERRPGCRTDPCAGTDPGSDPQRTRACCAPGR